MQNEQSRYYDIDLLRFLAALAVVLYHYTYRGYIGHYSPIQYPILSNLFQYGYLGVNLFFIISGYVITLTAEKKNTGDFIISRIVRLYPAYWTAVTITFLFLIIASNPPEKATSLQYLINLTMIQEVFNVENIDGVYWTLLIELKFYFLIFILLIFNQFKNLTTYLYLWISLSIGIQFANLPYIGFFFIPEWSSYFIAGATFYMIRKEGIKFHYIILLITCLFMSLYTNIEKTITLTEKHSHNFSLMTTSMYIMVFYIFFSLISLNKTSFINNSKFYYAGVLTYPLYLLHQNIGYIYLSNFNSLNKYITLCLLLILMFILSYLTHVIAEIKGGRILKNFLYKIKFRVCQ